MVLGPVTDHVMTRAEILNRRPARESLGRSQKKRRFVSFNGFHLIGQIRSHYGSLSKIVKPDLFSYFHVPTNWILKECFRTSRTIDVFGGQVKSTGQITTSRQVSQHYNDFYKETRSLHNL